MISSVALVAGAEIKKEEYPLGRDVRTIRLTNSLGSITWKPVEGWQGAKVVVGGLSADPGSKLKFEDKSDRYTIDLTSDHEFPVHFTIYAPADQITELRAKTSNGSITIEADFRGLLNLETSNGSIVLYSGAGQVQLKTSNGSINLGSTRLTTSSTVRTSNGTIFGTVALPIFGSFTFENSNGRIDLRLPPDTRGIFDLSTSNGVIDFRLGHDVVNGTTTAFIDQTRVNRGRGPNVVIRTSNGNISVQEEHYNFNWKF